MHTEIDIAKLKQRLTAPETVNSNVSSLQHLFTVDALVDLHNMEAFEKADDRKKCEIAAIDAVDGDVKEETRKIILNKVPDDPSKTMGLVSRLLIVENLPAEICINIDVEDGLTNGTSCIVKKLDFRVKNSTRCSIIWVEFETLLIGAKARSKYAHLYTSDCSKTWTPILEITRNFNVGQHRNIFVIRRQFPLRLACAKTIHKSQGSTMNKAVLHFGSRKIEHMHYVGLSRIKKLNDVFILELNEKKIAVSKHVMQEMERLRTETHMHSCVPILKDITSDLKIVYHNTRSLHLHIRDLAHESNMHASDIIAISESRLKQSDKNDDYNIPGFHMYRFDDDVGVNCGRSYKGIVVYTKLGVMDIKRLFLCENVDSVLVCVTHNGKMHQIVFLYCSPQGTSLCKLCNILNQLLGILEMDKPIIIMGDTNVDFNNQNTLSKFMDLKNIRQLVQNATTDYGTCLDHLYTNMMSTDQISSATLESYYSDHKPIVAYLPFL